MVPVISSHCDYKKGAKLEDDFNQIMDWEKSWSRLKIFYEATLKKTNTLIVTGYTVHVFINTKWRVIKPPDNILNILKK